MLAQWRQRVKRDRPDIAEECTTTGLVIPPNALTAKRISKSKKEVEEATNLARSSTEPPQG